jgi:hypothetical protein
MAVTPPNHNINMGNIELNSNKGEERTKIYTPAVTIVAACISADTGVGPSIAIGSQTCKPICALLAIAPIIKHIPMIVIMFVLIYGASENTIA